ncbi:hypothetical protein GCM10018793_61750 [Streptomyces sulfonofaciens]|uniref:Uncharacterized protein n=1 Tax=Streptomyces sulfonofaciens TaxID=68272 RepID=A0A919L6W6_9ACTN|nr:hypothetical protein [Streptomyces sulfonofaciens]GHH87130.1 hypothetical protein GCM10018793_61750 [Streptomyces sulfonofaciens]
MVTIHARIRRVHDVLVEHTGLGLGQVTVLVTAVLADAAWALSLVRPT